jgi:hypothetical protein
VHLPGSFSRNASHTIPGEETNEDNIGQALPESVIAQLDAHLDALGRDFGSYGHLTAEQISAMFHTIYVILRDTGRRPLEVASLPRDCLESEDGEVSLVWNNTKSRRCGGGCPSPSTQCRSSRTGSSSAASWRHPLKAATTCSPRSATGSDALPDLRGEATRPDGEPVPFRRSKVFPYAFRHS